MTIYIVDSHWRHQNYEWTHMELCSKQKVWNNSKHVSYFRFFNVASLCFVGSAANPWPSLSELHDGVTWNGFNFTGVSCQGSFVEFLAFLMGVGPSVKPSVKTMKRDDETGSHEDRPRKGRPRVTSAAEEKFIWSGLCGQIAAKKKHY